MSKLMQIGLHQIKQDVVTPEWLRDFSVNGAAEYKAGLIISKLTTKIEYEGIQYLPKSIPFTTSTWDADKSKFELVLGLPSAINGRDYGVIGDSTSETSNVESAVKAAVATNVPVEFNVPKLYMNSSLPNFSNVVSVGNQYPTDWQGLPSYRQHPNTYLKGSLTTQALDFEYLLPKYCAKETATIVFVGDSLMTYGGDSLTNQDCLSVLLQHKFLAESKKNIVFHNRAIAGQMWENFASVPFTFPSWYSDQSKKWYEYVTDLSPDVVILGFGMNDGGNFDGRNVVKVVDQIRATGAEVIFVTNLVPTLEPDKAHEVYGTREGQETRDNVASFVRGYARKNHLALLDMHDYFCQLRDGFCPTVTYFERKLTDAVLTTGNSFSGGVDTYSNGSAMELLIEGLDLINKVYTQDAIRIRTGSNFNDFALISASDTDTFKISMYGGAAYKYAEVDTGVAIPNGTHKIYVSMSDDMFTFTPIFRGSSTIPTMIPIISHGGNYAPQMQALNKSHNLFSKITLDVAITLKVNKGEFNDAIWGKGLAAVTKQLPYGGNGVNHLTTIGVARIYKQFLKQYYFR